MGELYTLVGMSEPLNQDFWVDQLETIHKQLNDDDSENPNSEGTNISGSSSSGITQRQQKRHSMFSGFLNKRDKSSDLPVFAGSSSHHGVLAANSSQDMTFVMGLSENLLLECRRLQADIERKSSSLNSAREAYDQLQENYDALNTAHSSAVKDLEFLKGANLDLQSRFEDISANFQNSQNKLAEKEQTIEGLSKAARTLENDTEIKNISHMENVDLLKKQYSKEIEELRETVAKLRGNNDELGAKLQDMDKLKALQTSSFEEHNDYRSLQSRLHNAHQQVGELKKEIQDLQVQNHLNVAADTIKGTASKGVSAGIELESSKKQIDSTVANIELYGDENIVALPNDNPTDKSHIFLSSYAVMKEKLESMGYKVITYPEYNEMKSNLLEWENPSESYLVPKITSRGKIVISKENYEELLAPSVSEITRRLEEKGYSVFTNAEHQKLMGLIESPDLEYIKRKLELQGLVAVSEEDYEKLSSIGKTRTLISTEEYQELKGKVTSMNKEELEDCVTKLGMALVSKSELENMNRIIGNPSVEFHEQKLKEVGYTVLDSGDFERLKAEAASPSLEKITEIAKAQDYLLVHARDLSVRGIVDSEKIGSLCDSESFVLINKETHDALLNGGFDKINKSEVIKLCSKVDLIPISPAKYEEMAREPDMDRIKHLAAEKASVVISRESYEILRAEADCPTEEAVRIFAEQNGLALVIKSDYDLLLEKLDSPSKHQLEKQAERIGLTLVSADKYSSLLHELSSRSIPTTPSNASKVLASKQYFEEVIRHENEKSEKILESTKTLGFVTLSNKEYRTLRENQKDRVVTKTDIYHGAKNYDLAVLPNEEYKALLKKKSGGADKLDHSDLEKIAARFNMKLIPFDMKTTEPSTTLRTKTLDPDSVAPLKLNEQDAPDAFRSEERIENENSPATEEIDQIRDTSTEFSPKVISSKIASGSRSTCAKLDIEGTVSSKTCSISFDDLQKKAISIGYSLAALPNQDSLAFPASDASKNGHHGVFDKSEDRSLNVDHISEERLECLASQLGMVTVFKTEYRELLDNTFTRDFLDSRASELGLIILSENTYKEMSSRDVISKENIKAIASKFGLQVFSEDELASLKADYEAKFSKMETIEANAKSIGYILLKKERMEELEAVERAATSHKQSREHVPEAESLNSVESSSSSEGSHQAIPTTHSTLGCDELQALDLESSLPLTRQQIIEQAEGYGLVVLDEDQYTAMNKKSPMTKEQITEQARKLKLIVLDELKYELMKKPSKITEKEVAKYAKEHGLVLSDKAQIEHLGSTPTPTKEQLISYARQYDLVAISCEDYKRLKKTVVLSKEQLIKQVQNYNMVAINFKDYEDMKRGISKGPSQSKPPSQKAIGDLDVTRSKTSSRPSSQYGDEFNRFFKLAIKNGIWKTPKGKSFPVPVRPHDVVLLPKSYFDGLSKRGELEGLESDLGKRNQFQTLSSQRQQRSIAQAPKSSPRLIEPERKKSVVQASAINSHTDLERPQEQKVNSAGTSMRRALKKAHHPQNNKIVSEPSLIRSNSLSGVSLASVASLTEPSIIPALTQTVIGEYLYKYYRFFGVESRHERFFWIHPYTLTLYWSSTNPVLETKSSAQRTKSAAILGVESVSDSNPYPAGLYHKSLLIKSDQKTVKITCPTRKRHNIWYNSLRYLIQRSMEGIKLEGIADDPDDNLYSGKVFPLPSEISNLNSNTFSSFHRLSSSKKSNRNLVPRSPSMPVKKM